MGLETVREVLGQLQTDADLPEAWNALTEATQPLAGESELVKLLAAAREAHASRGEWEAVVELLPLEVEQVSDQRRVTLLMEQARVLQQELLDEAGAIDVYRQVLELAPDDELVLAAIAESEDRRPKWKAMKDAYIAEAEGAPDDIYKASMLMRAAEMEWRFAGGERSEERVLGLLAQAAEADPKNTTVLHMLERIYRKQDNVVALPAVLERWSKSTDQVSQAVSAAIRLARLQKNRLADADAAAVAYELALKADPAQPEAMEWLVGHYSEAEDWDRLVQIYENQLSQYELNRSDRVGDMLQIAMLHHRKRNNEADALAWFDRIRAVDPTNPAMLDFYREHCAETGKDGLLLEVLHGAQRVLKAGEQKSKITQEIARLAEGQEDAQKAIDQYKSLLRQNPDDDETRDALKGLYRKTGGYNQLVDLLQQELERLPETDTERRLAILREVAGVYRSHIPNDTSLVSALNQILRIDERDTASVRELIALYGKLERWRDLLTNQQRLAALSEDAVERAELLRDAGRRWLQQFSNVQNATTAFEALLEIVPGDREARDTLASLYKKRRAWPALYQLYSSELQVLTGAQRIAVMKEMAELAADRLGERDTASVLYKQILEAEPDNMLVLDALEKQAERARDWATLAEALEHRVGALEEPNAKVVVLQKLGTVYSDHLHDAAKSVAAWRRVLELQPGHGRATRVLRDAYLKGEDYAALEALYTEQQDFEALAEVLSNTADRTEDIRAKIDLSYRAARVYEQELGQPERAFRSYERVLGADPMDTRAARALVPLYEQDEKWGRLPPLYELLLSDAATTDEKLKLYERLADVTGRKLSDRKAAVQFARKAYELDPERPDALQLFEAACEEAGTWEPYVAAIEARLQLHRQSIAPPPKGGSRRRRRKSSEPAAGARQGDDALTRPTVHRLELKLAQKYTQSLGRTDDAVAVYKRLLEAQPDNDTAGAELEELLQRESRHDDLRWLIGFRVENANSEEAEFDLMRQWAKLEEEKLGDLSRSAELYRRLLERVPRDREALIELPRLLLALDDAPQAAKILEQHRDLAEAEERAALDAELAEVFLNRLNEPDKAFEAAVRAIESGSESTAVVEVLRRLAEIEATKVRAAEVLAEVYRRSGENRREAEALVALLNAEQDPTRRMELYVRAVGVFEQLDSYGSAFDVMLRACHEFSDNLELWDRANVLCEHAGRSGELADAYRQVLQADLPGDVQRALCERAATLHSEQLGDPVGATPYLEKVLELEPGNQEAFNQLKQILTSNQKWGELTTLYERTAHATDDEAVRIEILAEVAMICEEFVEDSRAAVGYYEEILELDSEQPAALVALDRLYSQHENYDKLEALLDKRLALEGDLEAANELRLRLAVLQLDESHRPSQAVEHLGEVLAKDTHNVKARELTERVLQIGSLRGPAAAILEQVYEARDEVRDLVRVLDVHLEVLRETASRSEALVQEESELLQRLMLLRNERLRDDSGTLKVLEQYVPLRPADDAARDTLLEICGRLHEYERVALTLEAAAANSEDPIERGEILLQAAELRIGPLAKAPKDSDRSDDEEEPAEPAGPSQPEQAEKLYQTVLELNPQVESLALPAARALEAIYAAREAYAPLVANLRVQLELVHDAGERLELLGRIAQLSENKLDDSPGAIEAWKERLGISSADHEALSSLDRLYEKTEDWSQLADILELRRESAEAADERKQLYRRTADLLNDRLDNRQGAIDAYRASLEEFGADDGTLSALEGLLAEAECWEELADAYEMHLDLMTSREARLELMVKIGNLRREHLSNVAGALELYRQVVAQEPSHADARAALRDVLSSDDRLNRREAAEILLPLYETEDAHEQLLSVLEILIETTEDPVQRLEVLRRAVEVGDADLGEKERALGYARTAVREAAGHAELTPWLETLERLSTETGEREQQVQLLREVVDEIFDGDVQFSVVMTIARLARDELSDKELALSYFKNASQLNPDSDVALAALEELYEGLDAHLELLDVLERRTELQGEAQRKQLLFKRGTLLAEKLDAPDRAISVFETILEEGFDERAGDALDALYRREKRWEELVELYRRRQEVPGADVASIHVKAANVISTELNDPFRAFEELEAALGVTRQHDGAINELERLMSSPGEPEQHARAATLLEPIYLARADYDRLIAAIEARLEYAGSPEDRKPLLHRLAQLHEEQKEDYAAAFETTARLLHEDPEDQTTVNELERLARVADQTSRLAGVYAAELEQAPGDDDATRHMAKRAGELYRDSGDVEKALKYFRRALDSRPDSRELFEAIDKLLEGLGRHEERVAHYRRALDHRFESKDRLDLLHTIAKLEAEQLGQKQDAIDTYVEALALDETDAVSLDTLSRLYYETQRYEDLFELVSRRAEAAPDQRRAATYRLALARLSMNELKDTSRAIDQLEEIVHVVPDHEEALKELDALRKDPEFCARVVGILLPIYANADDWRRIVKLNEDRFRLAEYPADKVAVLRETASLWENRGGEPNKALSGLAQAMRLDPEDDGLRAEYQRLVEYTNAWDDLAKLYTRLLQEKPDLSVAADMWLVLARCHDESRDDPRAALEAYTRLHELDHTDLEVVERMEALATLLSDWEVLDNVLEAKATLVLEDEERAGILRRIAEGRRDMLGRTEGAIAAYERALELEPDSAFTIDCLIPLYETANNPQRLVELYQRRVELADEDDVDVRYENLTAAAARYEKDFDDRHQAIDLLNQALAVKPDDGAVLEALGRLYEAEEQWPELLDNLATRAGIADELEQRVDLNRKRGDVLADKLESPLEALEAYQNVLQESPGDPKAQKRARTIGEQHEELREQMAAILLPALQESGAHQQVVEVLELRLTGESDPLTRAQTLRAMARVLEGELSAKARAHAVMLRAMAEVPEDDSIHSELERLSTETSAWEAYAEALSERALNTFDADLAKELFVRLGSVCESKLESPKRATDAYVHAVEQVGDQPELMETLDRLYAKQELWSELLDILERRAVLVDSDAERALLHQRLAFLQIDCFEEPGQGLSSLRMALELDPSLVPASEKMESILDRRDLFDEAADVLENVYRSRGDVERLTALSEKRVEYAETRGERIDMRKNLARVLEEEMADAPNAQRVLQQGLDEDPSDQGLLQELERLAQVTGEWASAARALEDAIKHHEELSPDAGRELCMRLAEWYADHIDDALAAEHALERAFTHDPQNEEVLVRLETLQSMPGRELAKVDTLRRRAKLQYDEQTREQLYRDAKELAEGQGEDQLSDEILRELLSVDDANLWAVGQLCELREKAGDHEETLTLLLRRAALEYDGAQIAKLKLKAAEIARNKLNQKEKAVQLYRDLFEDDPVEAQAPQALRELYAELGKYEPLAELLERLVELTDDTKERCELRIELARLHHRRFSNADRAIEILGDLIADEPGHPDAVVLLSKLYEECHRDEELAELLVSQIASADERRDDDAAVRFELRLAEICESRLKDPTRAIEAYQRVLQRQERHADAMRALGRLYRETGDLHSVCAVLLRRIEFADADERLPLVKELVATRLELDDDHGAIEALESARELDPADEELRKQLRELYTRGEAWTQLGELTANEADLTGDRNKQVALLRDAAEIFASKALDLTRAAELLEQAAEKKPGDRALLLRLCDAYNASGRGQQAVGVLERLVESYGGRRSKELGEIHRRLSDAYQSQGDKERAVQELDKAFRIEPGNVEVLKALGMLSLEIDDLKRAQQMFRALLLQKLDDKSAISKAQVFYYLGLVHHRLGETPKATQMLERALQTDPGLKVARDLLAEVSG